MFLRVDILPNKLYKWNGQKWIEVVKSTTDRYAYEEEYIKYITTKIIQGEYDMDDLSKPEQDAVLKLSKVKADTEEVKEDKPAADLS